MAGGRLNPKYAPLYVAAGRQYHIDPAVLAGVADVETNGGYNISTSSTGAQGLMQFEPSTARSLGVNPYNARSAIFGAAKLLNQMGYQHNPLRALGAYNGGPGNPQYGYANLVMRQAGRLRGSMRRYLGGSAGVVGPPGRPRAPRRGRGGVSFGPGAPSVSTSLTGGGTDFAAAITDALLSGGEKPINPSGKFTAGGGILARAMQNVSTGAYSTPSVANSTVSQQPVANPLAARSQARGRAMRVPPGMGDINPLGHGWSLGQTDMGIDANARPGTPIRAINDSVVTAVIPGWYSGQPLVAMKILAGPNRGKYWYVAEQIHGIPHRGQVIRRGQVVATYAPSGTGIEIGWAANGSGQTLAAAHGHGAYAIRHAPGGTPEGRNFRHVILRA